MSGRPDPVGCEEKRNAMSKFSSILYHNIVAPLQKLQAEDEEKSDAAESASEDWVSIDDDEAYDIIGMIQQRASQLPYHRRHTDPRPSAEQRLRFCINDTFESLIFHCREFRDWKHEVSSGSMEALEKRMAACKETSDRLRLHLFPPNHYFTKFEGIESPPMLAEQRALFLDVCLRVLQAKDDEVFADIANRLSQDHRPTGTLTPDGRRKSRKDFLREQFLVSFNQDMDRWGCNPWPKLSTLVDNAHLGEIGFLVKSRLMNLLSIVEDLCTTEAGEVVAGRRTSTHAGSTSSPACWIDNGTDGQELFVLVVLFSAASTRKRYEGNRDPKYLLKKRNGGFPHSSSITTRIPTTATDPLSLPIRSLGGSTCLHHPHKLIEFLLMVEKPIYLCLHLHPSRLEAPDVRTGLVFEPRGDCHAEVFCPLLDEETVPPMVVFFDCSREWEELLVNVSVIRPVFPVVVRHVVTQKGMGKEERIVPLLDSMNASTTLLVAQPSIQKRNASVDFAGDVSPSLLHALKGSVIQLELPKIVTDLADCSVVGGERYGTKHGDGALR
ncbi:hypothetical protein QBC35DRAFT_472875 [Podospora australis]|uniref:Uncharacterized protein n=1 Tax=Podospora australis TaxID=1536484 RepID=A0AAN7AJQ1_9PEZI|nr:hypothetical protein QBC35DRAFT_472875 [Podospora australis]